MGRSPASASAREEPGFRQHSDRFGKKRCRPTSGGYIRNSGIGGPPNLLTREQRYCWIGSDKGSTSPCRVLCRPERPKGQLYKQDKKSVETYKVYILVTLEGKGKILSEIGRAHV